jgi:PAS domain S-box-containing protein
MKNNIRKSGIDILGDIPWGSHLCQFYETKEDLIDLLVPYFKAGLENNEFCLWITCRPLAREEALQALRQALPDLDHYIAAQQIEVYSHKEWFLINRKFNPRDLLSRWFEKYDMALKKGFDGMRINGNEAWLRKKDWEDFMKYEVELHNLLDGRRMIGLCAYPLSKCKGAAIFDVAHAHESAITRRKGHWEALEAPEIKKMKVQLQRKSNELEIRVAERTKELKSVIEQLQKEIEERKKAEEKLRQSENLLSEAEHLAHVGSWSLDLRDKRVTWSDELYVIFGIQPSEFDHTLETVIGFSHPDDKSFIIKLVEEAITNRKPYDFHYRMIRPNGEERILHVRGTVMTDELGKPARMNGAVQDVTERKKAEDELRQTYQRLSYHVENTPLAVIEWDKDLYITRWSEQAEKIFGWKASEVLGRNRYDQDFPIVYKEDEEKVAKVDYELMQGLVDRNLSLNRNYTKEGKVIYCEWYNSVLRDEKGNVITILSLIQDVTERKRTEEKLNESYEQIRSLSEHLRSIREEERKYIAREIHDELGQYLTVLKMDVGVLNKKLNHTDDFVQRKLNGLSDNIDNAVHTVRRIASELRPTVLDELGLAAAIAWHLEEFEKRSGIKTHFTEPEKELDLPEPVKTNLFRIFQESMTNVARHANATDVTIDLTPSKGHLTLSIADNGIGLATEVLSQKKTMGILGMKERTAIIGGTYEIQSAPGKGTLITVKVPLSVKPGKT